MKIVFDKNILINIYIISLILLICFAIFFTIVISKIITNFTVWTLFHILVLISPLFLTIVIINFIKNNDINQIITLNSLNNYELKKPLLYAFITGYLLLITYFNVSGETKLLYAFFLLILYVIIFFQITLTLTNPVIIIAELVLTFIHSIFSIIFRYPNFYGNTDVIVHLDWTAIIFATGRLLPNDIYSSYQDYPVTHILTGMGSLLSNLSLLNSYLGITGIVFSLGILFIYCFFRLVVQERIALLACLFYSISNLIIWRGLTFIPFALAYIFFILFLFLLLKFNSNQSNKFPYIVALIPLIVALEFTHVGAWVHYFLILYLFCVFIVTSQYFFNDNKKINFFPIILLTCAFLIHWFYVAITESQNLTTVIFRFVTNDGILSTHMVPSLSIENGLLHESTIYDLTIGFLINNFLSLTLTSFILVGIGFAIKQKDHKILWAFSSFALFSLAFWTPIGASVINIFFEFSRLTLFFFPFTILIFAFGFYNIFNLRFKYQQKYVIILLTLIFICYSFTSLYTGDIPYPNFDNSKYIQANNDRWYLTEEDMTSINYIETWTKNNVMIQSTWAVTRYFEVKRDSPTIKNLGWHTYQSNDKPEILYNSKSDVEQYILFRKNITVEQGRLKENTNSESTMKTEREIMGGLFINFNKILNTGNNVILVGKPQ